MRHPARFPMPVILLMASGAILLEACTATREVGYGNGQTSPEQLLKELSGREVTISSDSAKFPGIITAMSADSLSVQSRDSALSTRMPLQKIRSIHREGTGATNGFLGGVLGLAGGAGLGYLLGNASDDGGFLSGLPGAIGAGVGGLVGVLIGATIGSNIDPSCDYEIPDEAALLPAKDVELRVARLIAESAEAITFTWARKNVTLLKSQVVVKREADGSTSIRMSRVLFEQINGR